MRGRRLTSLTHGAAEKTSLPALLADVSQVEEVRIIEEVGRPKQNDNKLS